MKTAIQKPSSNHTGRNAAVTMIELMVSVTLISFIILSLYQMFARTQEQMRRAMRQVDTLESGRAIMNVIQRDLSLMTYPDQTAINPGFMWSTNWTTNIAGYKTIRITSPVDNSIDMATEFDRFFFNTFDSTMTLTNYGGVGYHVGSSTNKFVPPADGIGTLYRYSFYDYAYNQNVWRIFNQGTNHTDYERISSRLIDNVVHFRVNPYPTNSAGINNWSATDRGRWNNVNFNSDPQGNIVWSFVGQTLPQLVEIEIGYVDEETAGEARALLPEGTTDTTPARNFIASRPEKINLFRFVVPIRVASQ